MQQTLTMNQEYKSNLTPKRRQIFYLMVLKGYDSTKIADYLGVAKRTVINNRTLLYKDLGVKNQIELMSKAINEVCKKNAKLNKFIDECIFNTPSTPKCMKELLKEIR